MVVRVDPDDRSNRGRRRGRGAILDHAADRFAVAGLEELVGGVAGVRDVALAAGVAPATVNHHFPPGGERRNTRLAAAALHHALTRRGNPVSEALVRAAVEAAEAMRAGDPEALGRLARIAATDVIASAPVGPDGDPGVEAETAARFVALAAATRSRDAAEALEGYYASFAGLHRALYEGLLDATDRGMAAGLDVDDLALVISALADGFLARRRFDRTRATPELFARAVVVAFEGLSAPRGRSDEPDAADRLLPPIPATNLDQHKRAAVIAAARHVYDRDGWPGLTMAAVAAEAGVSRGTVAANVGDRGGLAAAVWGRWPDGLTAQLLDDLAAGLDIASLLRAHLLRISELARRHHRLTGAFLSAVYAYTAEHGQIDPDDPVDPRLLGPIPLGMVEPVLGAAAAFRPGYADSPAAALDTAVVLVSQVLDLGMIRPGYSPAEVVHLVCDTTLAGMLRDRLRDPGAGSAT